MKSEKNDKDLNIKQKQDYELFVKFVAEMIRKYGNKFIKKKSK